MIVGVDVGAPFALARVALHAHAEMLRRARDRGADRADAEQADLFPAQRPGRRLVPPAFALRSILVEEAPLVREQIREDVLGHQPAEDAARVRQRVVAAQRRIEQRLDAGPRRLNPFQRAQRRKHLPQERGLAEREVGVRAARRRVNRIDRRGDRKIGKGGGDQAVIVARVAREDEERVHN